MNPIFFYLVSLLITFIITLLLILYLRPSLKRILFDLCGTEERAHFWTVFSVIVLVATPFLLGMGYHPAGQGTALFFEMATQIRSNLFSFLFALGAIGGVVTFFALFAPRPKSNSTAQ